MHYYRITLESVIGVPDEAATVHRYDGTIRGFQLPDLGTVIKPQLVLEQHMEDDGSVLRDLTHTQAGELGFDYGLPDGAFIVPHPDGG